ncbi:hypothetical protein Tco_0450325, partial [Tanacetum coccineum]
MRALVSSHVDLLPPRKRFRDSISLEDNVEEDIDANVLADIEADAITIEVAVDKDVEAGVDAGIGMDVDVEDDVEDEAESSDRGTMKVRVDVVARIDIPNGMLMPVATEHLEQVEEVAQDIDGHVMEIPLHRVEDIETGQRELEARSLIAGGERASLLEQVVSLERSNARLRGTLRMERARADRRLETFAIMTITRSGMTPEAIEEHINQQVAEALAAYEAKLLEEDAVFDFNKECIEAFKSLKEKLTNTPIMVKRIENEAKTVRGGRASVRGTVAVRGVSTRQYE